MVHVGVDLSFDNVHTVLAATVLELDRNKDKIASPGPKDDVEQIKVSLLMFNSKFFIPNVK
jgi:K+/H+ antiporter YhaU regulatory subunit KhtT